MIAGTELRRQGCSLQDGKQWGFTVFDPAYYKNVNFTLPLSVNGTFCAFSTGYDAKGSTFLWHSMSHFNNVNVGVTGFVFDSRYTFTGLGYLAVCWQKQWGKILGDTVNLKIINFPVSFNECFGGLALFNGDPVAAAEYATITDITNTNFKIYMYANNAGTGYANANIFYLFLGAQPQWGINTGGAVRTSTLPIPFTNVFLAVASTSSEWCCPGCSATNTTVTTRAYQSNRPDVAQPNDVNWIIIGCQPQWGTCGSGINNLPLSFNEKIFICVVTDITSSTNSSDGYFSFNNEKSTINSIFTTSSGAHGGNYIVAGV